MNDWRSSYDCHLCALSAVIIYGEGSAEASSPSPSSDVEDSEEEDDDDADSAETPWSSPSTMMSAGDKTTMRTMRRRTRRSC